MSNSITSSLGIGSVPNTGLNPTYCLVYIGITYLFVDS